MTTNEYPAGPNPIDDDTNTRSDVALVNIAISALFVCNADGRLQYIREPGYEESKLDPAPRFFLGRTRQGNVCRFRHDLPDALVNDLERLTQSEPVAVDLAEPPHQAAAIRAVLKAHAPITNEGQGPAYWFPDTVPAPPEAVLISDANAQLLKANFPWMLSAQSGYRAGPVVAVVAEDSAVSVCFCARLTPQAAEAGVETVEAFRGQGYASAAVAGWSVAARQRGLIPLYSTSWENVASQGVARKLGLVRYAAEWSIT